MRRWSRRRENNKIVNNCKNISTRNETRHVSYKDTRNQLFDPFLKIITKILALARNETRHVSYKDTRNQLFDPFLKIITKILALARNETRHVSYKDTRNQLSDPLLVVETIEMWWW